jgi:hypothetical protein
MMIGRVGKQPRCLSPLRLQRDLLAADWAAQPQTFARLTRGALNPRRAPK